MTQFDRMALGKQALELGFVRDTFEKVCRLIDVLAFIESDSLLSKTLALKGGTAINLVIFNLPRLSVDIDLDFALNLQREDMLSEREKITERIARYMKAAGYSQSVKSKKYHALDSFVYDYQNAGGIKDNMKIEINYMLRCHALPLTRRQARLPWVNSELTVLSVDPIEIFASKIVALLNRTAPRDLFDTYNMSRYGLFDEAEQVLLRKCVILYSAIGARTVPDSFNFDSVSKVSEYRIKTDLLPVLRRDERFDLKQAQVETVRHLSGLLVLCENELAFWRVFSNNEYRPDLLFGKGDILERIINHPMALWKCDSRDTKRLG